MINKMHQQALLLFALPLFHLIAFSQTVSSLYQPGVTTEGAVYFLPKTAIAVTVTVEKTTIPQATSASILSAICASRVYPPLHQSVTASPPSASRPSPWPTPPSAMP